MPRSITSVIFSLHAWRSLTKSINAAMYHKLSKLFNNCQKTLGRKRNRRYSGSSTQYSSGATTKPLIPAPHNLPEAGREQGSHENMNESGQERVVSSPYCIINFTIMSGERNVQSILQWGGSVGAETHTAIKDILTDAEKQCSGPLDRAKSLGE